MYYVSFTSLLYCLSIYMKYVKVTLTEILRATSEFEKVKFVIYFFSEDISFNIS